MKHIATKLPFSNQSPLVYRTLTDDSILFDIETTGFSARSSSLYLIGCAYRADDGICVEQFLAQEKSDEAEILGMFHAILSRFATLICFNGQGFDLPFLKTKYSSYHMEDPFSSLHILDLYKEISACKKMLSLERLRLKSMEEFLGINRKDCYDGGMLIDIYHQYRMDFDQEKEKMLLLHNYEDVIHMIPLIDLLSYPSILSGNWNLETIAVKNDILSVSITINDAVPVSFSKQNQYASLQASANNVHLLIHLYRGSLCYFFSDYKNYDYLTGEDRAIHKSLSAFVDRSHKQPAKASNCYTKKEGLFVPQPKLLKEPVFYYSYKSKPAYFLCPDELDIKDPFWIAYTLAVIKDLAH